MKKIILMAAILVAYPVFAQNHPVHVMVTPANNAPVSHEISDRLAGRIGASSRYALTSAASAEIMLSVECAPNSVGDRQIGVTCGSSIAYWPVEGVLLSTELAGMIAVGAESAVAESLFDDFVQDTSDEKLAEAAKNFKHYLNSAIARFPHGVN